MTTTRNGNKNKVEVNDSPSTLKRDGFFYRKVEDNYEPEYKALVKTGSGRVLEKKKHVEEQITNIVDDRILSGDLSISLIEAEEDLTYDEIEFLYNESIHHFDRGLKLAKKNKINFPEQEVNEKKFKLNIKMGKISEEHGRSSKAMSYYAKASNTSTEMYDEAKKQDDSLPKFESDIITNKKSNRK